MTDPNNSNSNSHLAWKNALDSLDNAADSLLSAFTASGVSGAQYRRVNDLIAMATKALGGRPSDDAASYATFIAQLLAQHGDIPAEVRQDKNMSWQASFTSQTAGGGPAFRIDVTKVSPAKP